MSKYRFGRRSRKNLDEAHKDFTILFEEVLKERDCSIIEGERSEDEQNALYHAQKSRLRYPNSKHNKRPGQEKVDAVDVIPWPFKESDWTNVKLLYHFVGYVKGIADQLYRDGKITAKIRCGADWNQNFIFDDQSFIDLPHFERLPIETFRETN